MPDRSTDKFLSREVGSNEPYEGQIDGEIFAIRSGSSVFGIAGADGQAEAARQEAEAARQAAEEQRAEAQQANDAAQDANDSAQQANDTAQTANDAAQAKNNADQAANNQAAQGLQVVILTDGQYDPETREPTGTGNVGYMYFVPTEGDTEDTYVEWMWINSAWERVGMTNATLDPITTDQIDAVAADQSPTGDQTLNTTGLSYLWTKLKAAFSAIGHKHAAEDVTSGTLPIERGGTAASTAEGALTSLGAASATDLDELRESLSQQTISSGIEYFESMAANSSASRRIEFDKAYAEPPTVVCSLDGGSNKSVATKIACQSGQADETGVTLYAYNLSDIAISKIRVQWIAVGAR